MGHGPWCLAVDGANLAVARVRTYDSPHSCRVIVPSQVAPPDLAEDAWSSACWNQTYGDEPRG